MLRAGDQVGNYKIDAIRGTGGMATVYRATHTSLGSRHAIKVLNPEFAEDPSIRERFLHEGRVLAQLHHPGLVRVTEVVSGEGIAGLVMDLLEGEDLANRLQAGPLSSEVAAGLLLQALSALGHAHQAGVVHRDLKPANLFLVHRPGKLPLVKVIDFGIAKLRGLDRTQGIRAMGTAAYMSPEQIESPANVDARSDLFSLGVVLYEMVTGEPPYSGDTDFAVMQRIVDGRASAVPEHAQVLAPIIERALQTRPEDRFPDAASFAEVLRGLAPIDIRLRVAEWEGEGASAPAISSPAADPAPPPAKAKLPRVPPPASVAPPAPFAEAALVEPDEVDASWVELRSVARWAGILQLASGIVNLFMGTLQFLNVSWCPIFGLPAVLGLMLWIVGGVEILGGLSALVTGRPGSLRRTAYLEVASFAGGGVISGFVGLYVLSLRRRYPGVLP
ncbi:MAG: serine/threonine-protein kinase [Myxococcota bacterium]